MKISKCALVLCALSMVVVALAIAPVQLPAQATATGNGTVMGRITDSSGGVIPGVSVTLTDTSTNESRTALTNDQGLYVLADVKPGTYNLTVTQPGFQTAVISNQNVTVGLVLTLSIALKVGAPSETLRVEVSSEAQLQTTNSTMGDVLEGQSILALPTIARDASSLLFFQPTAAPTFNGAEGNTTSGNIAGNMADQNTYTLDGGNNTSDLDGDNATYVGHNGAGVMPTPVESVQEFKVNTNNMTSDFSSSGGAQILITTKRGTNTLHGSAYDFFQGDWLNSNDWDNNFHGTPKPKSHYNRFGGAVGGPMLPDKLGGKTYFYVNFEGERFPRTGPFTRLVPSDTLRQGIIQLRDASGNIVKYDLKTAKVCGETGGQQCDPRGIGINPIVSQMWSKYEPEPNDLTSGDRLNTFGYRGNLTFPLSNNFVVGRLDHDFGSRLRWYSSYRYFTQENPTTNQVDIGGLLPGDTKGQPAVASGNPLEPRYFVTGLTATLSSTLTNEFHFSYLRNFWQWDRAGAVPQISGIPGALAIGGESTNALIPMNIDTQNARRRIWDGHDYSYRDTISWLKGTHFFQFGGEAFHQWWHFDRYDNVVGGLTQLAYQISNSGGGGSIRMSPEFQPLPCSDTVTTNCLPHSELGSWNSLYSQVLGIVSAANIVATRTGANLSLNPLGTPVHSYVTTNYYSLYMTDAWKLKPNLTFNYGLNWSVQQPPFDQNGEQDVLVDPSGNVITTDNYLANRLAAANNGQVYNPTLGFSPVGAVGKGLKYPYQNFWGSFAPRVSLAWSPSASGGWLNRLLGNKATVIRGGYGRFYDRNLGINLVSTPVLGDGFLQPVGCSDPSITGQCLGSGGTNPSTAFRIGVDGNTAPLPAIPQTLPTPVQPGVNAAYTTFAASLDNAYRPGATNQIDFSIQRQLKGNMVLEIGYVGVWAKHLFQGIDINDVPWMMKLNGQTFAQAYDNMFYALSANKNVAPQPFFESALKGSSYCNGFANCTAAVAANESGNVLTQSVTSLWTDLDTSFGFGSVLPSTNQCYWCYLDTSNGFSNYQSLVVSLQKRFSQGLALNGNFTYGHSLGTLALNQAYTLNNVNNPWNLHTDYGPQFWDRKFTANILGTYQLPIGPGQRWLAGNKFLGRAIGGWQVSPILSIGSGLPLGIYTGSYQEFGNGNDGNGFTAIPLTNQKFSNSPNYGVKSDGTIGVNGDSANGGSGVNLFSNPTAVFNSFRPALVGVDGSSGGGGILRGQVRWNLDLALIKETKVTERVGVQIYAQMFNILNHMQWGDPGLNLQDPNNFGVLGGQYGVLGGNYTRIIQLGARIHF